MSNGGHGSSRRQAYGRRMKELRARRRGDIEIDLEGPSDWSRGDDWDDDRPLPRPSVPHDQSGSNARPR